MYVSMSNVRAITCSVHKICVWSKAISAHKHVAGSEEQQCIRCHPLEHGVSPALMAAIIKKAFRGGGAPQRG